MRYINRLFTYLLTYLEIFSISSLWFKCSDYNHYDNDEGHMMIIMMKIMMIFDVRAQKG